MAKSDEISSTNKLLELIREKPDEGQSTRPGVEKPRPVRQKKTSAKRPTVPFGVRKRITVGVEIGVVGEGLVYETPKTPSITRTAFPTPSSWQILVPKSLARRRMDWSCSAV